MFLVSYCGFDIQYSMVLVIVLKFKGAAGCPITVIILSAEMRFYQS